MKRDDVIHILHKQKSDLFRQYPIASLSVFGSVARDEAGPDSDVDILVEFSQPVGLFQFIDLQQQLEKAMGCRVDLGTPRSLKPRLKDSVIKEAMRVV